MPCFTSSRKSVLALKEAPIEGVAVPLRPAGLLEPGDAMVGCAKMLNMDVTGGRPCAPVCCEIRGGRLLGNGSEKSRRGAMLGGEKETPKGEVSVCGVCGRDPASLPGLLRSLSPLLSSSSSRMSPRTRLIMLPTTSSRGCAATSRLPTSWTFCISLAGSEALVIDTNRRSSSAVAIAHGFEPLICSRLSKLSCPG